ncbi:DUF503 domain-containing protein [Spirochaeta thermophila]|uniref:DUF503 domain-containing protein n=1 Tax=Winmispira thermophila (strain ATCC 49972 / DSM 6192 / RI 19.B1) TaxID=665571 RepID=E0RR50_WINT6|nr:DUF503 domain-containing protein [Spirochaeta thermophila]ADN01628.1 hypothetical protein STHERM_c06690 [Spirochaeta thermophila DSM 6192]
MVVSVLRILIELPGVHSLKEKRSIVSSLKEKLIRRFKISFAEVDLHDSLGFAEMGGAVVSNSSAFGEGVLQKVLAFVEAEVPGRVYDVWIHSEQY